MEACLHIALNDEMDLDDYVENLSRMYGDHVIEDVVGAINGDIIFHGLTKTSMKLEGIEPHLRLIDSYKKLHSARQRSN